LIIRFDLILPRSIILYLLVTGRTTAFLCASHIFTFTPELFAAALDFAELG
jgi:hypothetical protein